MQQIPTPWQYLLDLIVAARLKAAETIVNPVAREGQIKRYKGLKESECTFSTPINDKTTNGNWVVDITVPGRGFKLERVPYKTGTVAGMAKANTNVMLRAETLESTQTATGLYLVDETKQLHLLLHPQSNFWEALQMTGYQFTPKQFSVEQYDQRNEQLHADGHIDIKDSVVAGRLYVTFIKQFEKSPLEQVNEKAGLTPSQVDNPSNLTKQDISIPQELVSNAPVKDEVNTDASISLEHTDTNTEEQKPELTEEEQINALLAEEAAQNSQEEAAADQEESEQPSQNFNQKNKKNK